MFQHLLAISVLVLIAVDGYLAGKFLWPVIVMLCLFICALVLRSRRLRQRQLFELQLRSYRKELRAGGMVSVDGHLCSRVTPLRTYLFVVGGLLSTVAVPSPYYVGAERNHGVERLYALVSAFFGWISVPTGPFHATLAVLMALRGGRTLTVEELLGGITPVDTLPRALGDGRSS